eukprot:Opistho-2@16876
MTTSEARAATIEGVLKRLEDLNKIVELTRSLAEWKHKFCIVVNALDAHTVEAKRKSIDAEKDRAELEALRSRVSACDRTADTLQRSVASLEERLKATVLEKDALSTHLSTEKKEHAHARDLLVAAEANSTRLAAEVASLRGQSAQNAPSLNETASLASQVRSLEADLAGSRAELVAAKKHVDSETARFKADALRMEGELKEAGRAMDVEKAESAKAR